MANAFDNFGNKSPAVAMVSRPYLPAPEG